MPIEPGETRPPAVRPKAKVIDDGPVIVEVDGFALMTPEQRTWPVYSLRPKRPPVSSPAEPPADGG